MDEEILKFLRPILKEGYYAQYYAHFQLHTFILGYD